MARPRFGFVRFAIALPIEMHEDRESICILCPKILFVLVQRRAESRIEADAHRDVVSIHELHKFVKSFTRTLQSKSEVTVYVDDRELRAGDFGAMHFQHRTRSKLIECQVTTVLPVELLREERREAEQSEERRERETSHIGHRVVSNRMQF